MDSVQPVPDGAMRRRLAVAEMLTREQAGIARKIAVEAFGEDSPDPQLHAAVLVALALNLNSLIVEQCMTAPDTRSRY